MRIFFYIDHVRICAAVISLTAAAACAMPVHAQQSPPQRPDGYPVKSIRIILGIAPGGAEPVAATSPAEFRAIFTEEFSKWEKFFRTAGLKDMAR